MKSSTTVRHGIVAIASVLLTVSSAMAQDNPELGDIDSEGGGEVEAGGEVGASGGATWTAPTSSAGGSGYATPAATASSDSDDSDEVDVAPGDTDHSQFVERLGVGWFGIMELPTCGPALNMAGIPACDPVNLNAPTIGARYWLDSGMAIEGAIGLHMSGGETKTTVTPAMMPPASQTLEDASYFGFALHGGVPLVLADTKHVAFEVVPQLNFGIVSGSQARPAVGMPPMTPPEVELSGMLFELGGTIGTEVHFGFIDLPSLALQANVGMFLRYQSTSAKITNAGEVESSGFQLSTGVGNDPWDIFTSSVTAIYYL